MKRGVMVIQQKALQLVHFIQAFSLGPEGA